MSNRKRFEWAEGDLAVVAGAKAFYSPDQARDEQGRWSDGSGGETSPSLAGASGRGNLKIPAPSKIDPTFAAMTTHEAEQYLMNVHGVGTVKLDGVDQTRVGGLLQETDDLLNQYPGMLSALTTDHPSGSWTATATQLLDDNSIARGGFGGIFLNPKYFGDPLLAENMANWAKTTMVNGVEMPGFHDGMEDPRSIITHEFGHVLDDALSFTNASFTSVVRASGFGRISDTTSMFKKEHFAALSSARAMPITQYARTNDKEWFAETFAATRWGDKRARNSMDFYNMRSFLNIVASPNNRTSNTTWLDTIPRDDPRRDDAIEFQRDAAKKMGIKGWM